MICVFPDPYPDELLYSVCARYKDLMKYPNSLNATSYFFGTASSMVVDLPNKIDHLVSVLPPGHLYTADDFIDNHTMFPFYAPFLSRKRAAAVRDGMHRQGENQIFERIGLNASSVSRPPWLRFCSSCAREDRQCYGETYWHRTHQLTGIDICPRHSIFLERTKVPFRNTLSPSVAISAESAVDELPGRCLDTSDANQNLLLRIARNAVWLFDWSEGKWGSDLLRDRYYNYLLKLGLAYYNGNIRATLLADQFNAHFPPQLLEALDCKIPNTQSNWVLRLVRSVLACVNQLPIRHILLILFIGCTTEEFFTSPETYKPFGDGPWPCLNHTAAHFKQLVITECRITDNLVRGKTGRPLGTFSCECGFVYNRVGPDRVEEDRYQANSVESYGPKWEEVLKEIWANTSISVAGIARQLGVSDLTVVRYAIRLDLPMNAPNARQVSPKTIERYKHFRRTKKEAIEHYRKEWLSVIEANPSASRKQLTNISSFLYLWLRKHDSDWLEAHMPLVKKGERRAELKDWKLIDIELAAKVIAAASHLRTLQNRPVRLTFAAITREVGNRTWLEFRLQKLPLTTAALNNCLETVEEFLIRRVAWAEEYYFQKGICPARSYFEARAGTKHKSRVLQVVQGAIDVALGRLRERLYQ